MMKLRKPSLHTVLEGQQSWVVHGQDITRGTWVVTASPGLALHTGKDRRTWRL